MTTLLIADGAATPHALTAALALGAEVHVLELPPNAIAEAWAEPIAALAGYDAIVAPATSTGKNLLPRLAALLDVMLISDVVEVLAPDIFKRPTYAGSAIETVQSADARRIVTVRASAFPPTSLAGVTTITLSPADTTLSRLVSEDAQISDRPELGSAKIVVSGGRAFGSKETFDALLGPLAAKLDAAIGASRAAVDAGYAANDLQVGQTGKIVAPDLYIAIGISGAIQHLAGMKSSKLIVAINSDPQAPIFSIADYGLVGDLFALVPELTSKL
ncbi:MAG: electron transfer flavoprotein subunit alpha [Devosia sp. 67-54]|uniref:electron transfer flavoprotein subunit alpha/FixB family protein n=1 Tax=unclassified Devosia TaxID=196773 RepID=UPI00095DA0F1|nr:MULTISPECIES: FAD-binding protein [unclassified Devosia]MBN9306531.1 FAD-binding protein [Devosia sp.]OJX15819.1 MAG: electron transfer flavoprotein subunit alpha [Devosia sp. 67-54]